MASVKLQSLIDWLKPDNLTPDLDISRIRIHQQKCNMGH
jgi:hypothetical protein